MDQSILIYLNQTLAQPVLDVVAVGLTTAGLALLPCLGLALLFSPRRHIGIAILGALFASILFAVTFQYLGMRSRPEMVRLILPQPGFPSFPSGHATAAFSVAMVVVLSYRTPLVWIGSFTLAALIALSRVYLGHHYPSDILGGSVLGLSLGATAYGVFVASQTAPPGSKPFIWPWFLWPQLAIAFLATLMAYLGILPTHLLRWPYADKVIHFVLFGALAFWLNLWLRGRTIQIRDWAVPVALLILIAAAIVEESLQGLSSLRTLGWGDLLSNILGLVVFWWLSQQVLNGLSSNRQEG